MPAYSPLPQAQRHLHLDLGYHQCTSTVRRNAQFTSAYNQSRNMAYSPPCKPSTTLCQNLGFAGSLAYPPPMCLSSGSKRLLFFQHKPAKKDRCRCWPRMTQEQVDNYQASPKSKYNIIKEGSGHCFVCGKETSLLELKRDKIWGYLYCDKHDRISQCCSCMRLKPKGGTCFKFDDGRILCKKCFPTAVLGTKKLKSIISEVQNFYCKELDISILLDFPILLVDAYEMKTVSTSGLSRGATTFHSRPVQSTVQSIDSCILEEGKIKPVKSLKDCAKRTTNNEVVGIKLLYGRAEVLTASTLVHEIMHVWLRLQGCIGLEKTVTEGICEVMAHFWLERCKPSLSRTSETDQFLLKLLEVDKRPRSFYPYDVGFIEGKKAVDKYGIKLVLDEIVKNGKFPQ